MCFYSIIVNVELIEIFLIGIEGKIRFFVLEKWFYDVFWVGYEDRYVMEVKDVGELLMIKVEND